MSIIKQTIRRTSDDIELKINLGSIEGFANAQQEIDNYIATTSNNIINPVVDNEKRRFKLNPDVPVAYFNFYFYNISAVPQYLTFFSLAGFTVDEITNRNSVFLNSFFILDYYNTYDSSVQTKIFTTYLTKLNSTISRYNVSASTNQFYYLYVPESYIESVTGDTVTGYTKFSFYNAKTGNIQLFFNDDNGLLTTPEKLYFKTELNVVNKTWIFLNSSFPTINAKELVTSTDYTNRMNQTFTSYTGITQNYPSGSTYYFQTNKYSL